MIHVFLVMAVSVGALHDHVIRLVNVLGIADQGLVLVADIAGKDDFLRHAVFGGPDLDGRRAQKMAHVRETQGDIAVQLEHLAVSHPFKQFQHAQRVVDGV